MLSLKKYGWLCVLGAEVVYFACLTYGTLFLSGKTAELHRVFFETLPGFSWSLAGVMIGAIDIFAFAWIFAWFMVWMHNYSLIKKY